ncbi:MAG: DUF1573 domain-containing protein [Saprospiraceae bacterium]|nr:MAG: DUF1573 domain-containing protein [Saprospiraceae bacterium]
MLKQIKIGFLALLMVGFLASCKSDQESSKEQAVQTTTDASGLQTSATPGQLAPTANATQPTAPTGPTTTAKFVETEFNFGKVKAGEKVSHEYKFTNTGKEPLVISNAKGSCGCTVPQWPKEPIAPGASSSILVEFDSKGKSGAQTKQVTITANTDPPQSIIYIKGEVTPDPAAAAPAGAAKQ